VCRALAALARHPVRTACRGHTRLDRGTRAFPMQARRWPRTPLAGTMEAWRWPRLDSVRVCSQFMRLARGGEHLFTLPACHFRSLFYRIACAHRTASSTCLGARGAASGPSRACVAGVRLTTGCGARLSEHVGASALGRLAPPGAWPMGLAVAGCARRWHGDVPESVLPGQRRACPVRAPAGTAAGRALACRRGHCARHRQS
jgi:hypothetical protein